ncbi:MAG: histidinol-phosphate transaminase [Polyangiales bacterium]
MSTDPLVPPHIERLTPYVPGKPLEVLERELGITDAIKLASNENPLGPSPRAVEAAARALVQGHRYPDNYRLRAALAAHHDVGIDELVLGNGSNELIDMIARTFGRPGAEVVYPEPSFVCYRSSTIATDMVAREVPLRDHVHYDVDAFLGAISARTHLFFLANPNNPTGSHVSAADLERILRALPEHAIAVIDEAYVEFADAPDYASALGLRRLHERTIVLRTFSKAYGLAALRIGYGIAPSALIGYLERVRAPFNVSSIALAAAEAALADPAHVAHYVAHNARERTRVAEALAALGLTVHPSQANFLLVTPRENGRGLFAALERRGVIVRPMPPPIGDSIRVTLGTVAENDRLIATVRALRDEESP